MVDRVVFNVEDKFHEYPGINPDLEYPHLYQAILETERDAEILAGILDKKGYASRFGCDNETQEFYVVASKFTLPKNRRVQAILDKFGHISMANGAVKYMFGGIQAYSGNARKPSLLNRFF